MKKLTVIVLAVVMILGFSTFAMASWDKCKGCHTDANKPAAGKAELLKKFKSADAFIKAAKDSTNPMMTAFKDDAMLKAAAKEIGLK